MEMLKRDCQRTEGRVLTFGLGSNIMAQGGKVDIGIVLTVGLLVSLSDIIGCLSSCASMFLFSLETSLATCRKTL